MNYFSFYKSGKALYCLFFAGFLMSFLSSFGRDIDRHNNVSFQQNQVHGTVTDGSSPLPGVTISIKGKTNNSSITDYNGQYTINALASDTMIVSFIGFKTKFIPVNNSTKIDITLAYDTTTLQEVRVNAGYYSVKESDRTGSIARITSKDIETQPVTNILAAMQGRMAGVTITQQTGVPGSGFDIKIRGQNSLRADANAPLYIIDGVPYASDPIGSYLTGTTFPKTTSPINSINPDNIDSIEVLKDADATSIYGSRGANGVVLITTKKGRKGKTSFTLNTSTGVGTVTRFLKLMNTEEYLSMRRQAYKNDGITVYKPTDYDINGTWNQSRYTDWQKELTGGTSQSTDVQGSLSGGSEHTQYLLSGGFHKETTVFPGDFFYKRGSGQLNINHRSENNKFKINLSAGYNIQDNNQPSYDFTRDARTLAPNAPALYKEDGELNWENNTWSNPLRNLNTKFESKTTDLIASTLLSYEILPDLIIKSSFGYTALQTNDTRIVPSTIYNPAFSINSDNAAIFVNTTSRSSWIIEPQLSWSKSIGAGKLDMLAGATFQNQSTEILNLYGIGFTSNSLIYNLAAAKTLRILVDDQTIYKYQAFFARFNYTLNQRYIVNLTGRRDGSSRFGPGKQFASFGAVGAAWIFSKESFLSKSSWLSFGKLRTSYGVTGSDQIGDYQFLDTYTVSGALYDGITGLKPARLFNKNFGWETNKKFEAALETGFLQDRIFTTLAFYQNRSSNQLAGYPLPGTSGFGTIQSNLNALVQNQGVEFTIRTLNFNRAAFNWTTNFNITFAKNTLVKFPDLESSPYAQQYRLGRPLNIKLLYKYLGVNPQSGIYEFEDVDKDGMITFPNDRQTAADLNPKYSGGIQNTLTYKGFTLDFLFQFIKQKNVLYNSIAGGLMSNQQSRFNDSWSEPGDTAPYQRFTTGYNTGAMNGYSLYTSSTAAVADASFIRLKNISLTYNLPLHTNAVQCKILLQGQNLLTFTKYEDGDPEFINYGYLPPLKVFSTGIQLTF